MAQPGTEELTVDQLAAAAGVPVRRVRFYAGRRLLPPPELRGRVGLYGSAHLARLQLILRLQGAGYTLAAIEEFLADVPPGADADTVGLVGTLAAPATAGAEVRLTPAELEARVGVPLAPADLDALVAARVLRRTDDGDVVLSEQQLAYCGRMLRLGAPLDALAEAGAVIEEHVGALAAELQAVFRTRVVAAFDDPAGADREQLRALAAALRPLTIEALVTSYHRALDREVRAQADRAGGAGHTAA